MHTYTHTHMHTHTHTHAHTRIRVHITWSSHYIYIYMYIVIYIEIIYVSYINDINQYILTRAARRVVMEEEAATLREHLVLTQYIYIYI